MEIRTVSVELLRAGPRHNQLISPLTQYLGVCGNAPAARITLPFEHGELERRLQELRYGVHAEADPMRGRKVLDEVGREVAEILARIPGVDGALSPEEEQTGILTHLRIVISASELAMLPFEAAKVPTGEASMGTWVALQARAPVCVTRHIRSASTEGIRWPAEPHVLFVVGPDTEEPFEAHRAALKNALRPWRRKQPDRTWDDDLVVIEKATLGKITAAVAAAAAAGKPFTHVHVLAHGAPVDDTDRYSPVGIQLHDQDVVSGSQLATALISVTECAVSRPVTVTLATCDSALQADVRTTDASVAHDLHDQGIPLVVASQFPLSVAGSLPFVKRFYEGQFWGEHPLVSLYAVRIQLHSEMGPDTHDWASLVAYEAFPSNLAEKLEDVCYWQARKAQDGAMKRLEDLVERDGSAALRQREGESQTDYTAHVAEATAMSARLPRRGAYELECAGLRASGHKRLAQIAFQVAASLGESDVRCEALLDESLRHLEEARSEYWRAAKAILGSWAKPGRKKANLHWMLGQVLSLDVVLGREMDLDLLTAAQLAARTDLESPNEVDRAWAHVTLSELALLKLARPGLDALARAAHAGEAKRNAIDFLELLGRGSEHAFTTARQFERYARWWGNEEHKWALAALGVPDRPHWHDQDGIVPTASELVKLLRGPRREAAPDRVASPRTGVSAAAPVVTTAASPAMLAAPRRSSTRTPGSIFSVEMLPAENGDCLVVEYGDAAKPSRILIDCGAKSAVQSVAEWIRNRNAPNASEFELFVLTHIDADHINGVLTLFDQPGFDVRFADIWFNGWHQMRGFLSVKQGEAFSDLLEDPKRKLPWNNVFRKPGERYPGPVVVPADAPPPTLALDGGLKLTLLSPGPKQLKRLAQKWQEALLELKPQKAMLAGRRPPPPVTDLAAFSLEALASKPVKPDASVANGSSIALLAEYDGRAVLTTGDAHADVLVDSIQALQRARGREGERLKIDALKLSHHGSANATTIELLSALDCGHYLVSTNGNIFYHPDRESIARVILHGGKRPTLHFNYRSEYNALWDEPVLKERYKYVAEYPDGDAAGLRILL